MNDTYIPNRAMLIYAHPDDIEDLALGLDYCIEHRDTLGANGRELARRWTWPKAVEQVAKVYRLAMESDNTNSPKKINEDTYLEEIENAS